MPPVEVAAARWPRRVAGDRADRAEFYARRMVETHDVLAPRLQ
jgi:hypothetical protein